MSVCECVCVSVCECVSVSLWCEIKTYEFSKKKFFWGGNPPPDPPLVSGGMLGVTIKNLRTLPCIVNSIWYIYKLDKNSDFVVSRVYENSREI